MTTLRLILGDQLSESISALEGVSNTDTLLICEVMSEATYVKHHPKKIAFIFAAMRHFALELTEKGYSVRYIKLDDMGNTGNLTGEIERAILELNPDKLVVTKASEFRVLELMQTWQSYFTLPVEIRDDTRFLASSNEFSAWAKGKKSLRMEFFYRVMRVKHKILIEPDGTPTGGDWNYDKENRKPPLKGMRQPKRISHKKSAILNEVLALVEAKFSHHIGVLTPFHFAVTRKQALIELDDFIDNHLKFFGDYQDAMVLGQPFMYHSLISSYLNVGLLLPLEICNKAEKAFREGKAPLNAVEGFIRQILGWRDYIRGVYWLLMPDYGERNSLNATRPLPWFYWNADTKMVCMKEAITHTLDHAYSHHIQRLMVTGNFALLAGLDVKQVQEWYLAVYSDAFEWVEMPNTLGMALYGDDGVVASKPYAASGKYIDKMSNFCKNCVYSPNEMLEESACPFNALYWDFMARNEAKLKNNQRMPYIYPTWEKFGVQKQNAIRAKAALSLEKMNQGTL